MTKQSNFTNGDTSNLSGVEKFCKQLVEDGKLSQLPANFDCATLKMYISHLERENAELKAQLKNHRLMTMADGTVKQLYSVEEVEQIVKERDELKARLGKAVELPYERKRLLWGDKDKETLLCPDCLTDIMGGIGDETFVVQCPNCGCFIDSTIEPIAFNSEAEQRLEELKGGKE